MEWKLSCKTVLSFKGQPHHRMWRGCFWRILFDDPEGWWPSCVDGCRTSRRRHRVLLCTEQRQSSPLYEGSLDVNFFLFSENTNSSHFDMLNNGRVCVFCGKVLLLLSTTGRGWWWQWSLPIFRIRVLYNLTPSPPSDHQHPSRGQHCYVCIFTYISSYIIIIFSDNWGFFIKTSTLSTAEPRRVLPGEAHKETIRRPGFCLFR